MTTSSFDPVPQPDLIRQHAYDWLAVALSARPGPAACLATDTAAATEMARRVPGLAFVAPAPPGLAPALHALGLPEAREIDPAPDGLATLAWIAPTAGEAGRFAAVAGWLAPGGALYLVLAGPLARFTAEGAAGDGLAPVRARRLLARAGLRPRQTLALLGPAAIAWHMAARLAGALRLPGPAARCGAVMRRAWVRPAKGRPLAAGVLIAAERAP